MRKIKPQVIGYVQTHYTGSEIKVPFIWDLEDMTSISKDDLKETGIKSKFRPVYKKESI